MDRLLQLYTAHFGAQPLTTETLPVSGSHRSYYRLGGPDGTVIGAIGTDPDENRAFITLSRHFHAKGLPVPEVLAVSADGLRYLQEDLGTESLYDALASARRTGFYDEKQYALLLSTILELPRLQFEGAEGLDWSVCYPQPAFDAQMVDFDLNYFKSDFLKLIGAEFNEIRLQADFEKLKANLLAVPSDTFLYRDFQARNVMLRDGKPYFIDYQGGRRGPFYYDLASFVWQARAQYPERLKDAMIETYRSALSLYTDVPEEEFRRNLRLFVLFRTLQVL
ncbi:MAG: phosphotransferase, partial [Bacteroidota bacterium]|nr:phosphotransferase [Bacteroidota bacterium]